MKKLRQGDYSGPTLDSSRYFGDEEHSTDFDAAASFMPYEFILVVNNNPANEIDG